MLCEVSSRYAIDGGYALRVERVMQMPFEAGEVMTNPLITKDPFLTLSPLSRKVYVVTKYRPMPGGMLEAHTKFDVTRSFEDVAASLGYVKKEKN